MYQDHNEKYDLIIGNPPYATFCVKDRHYSELNELKIHHAFLARSIKLLNDNGLCIMLVPSYCLDTPSNNSRDIIAKDAKLIFACRLPDNLFDNAKITTDIVVFQKQANINQDSQEFKYTTQIQIENGYKDNINNYYIQNQNNIIGIIQDYKIWLSKENKYRQGLKVVGSLGEVQQKIQPLIQSIPNCYIERNNNIINIEQTTNKLNNINEELQALIKLVA